MRRYRLVLLALLVAVPVRAQVRTPGSGAVSEDSGPLGEDSGPVGEGSRGMYEGRTIGESSGSAPGDTRTGGSVRDATTRSMRSGPVTSMSSGSMTQPRTLPDAGSITENSAGAVKHDIDQPLGSRISQPIRELAPLQAQLRQIREHGSDAAVAAAQAPASAEPPPLPADEDGTAPEAALDAESGEDAAAQAPAEAVGEVPSDDAVDDVAAGAGADDELAPADQPTPGLAR